MNNIFGLEPILVHYLEVLHHTVQGTVHCLCDAIIVVLGPLLVRLLLSIVLGTLPALLLWLIVLGTLPAVLLRYICPGDVAYEAKHDL